MPRTPWRLSLPHWTPAWTHVPPGQKSATTTSRTSPRPSPITARSSPSRPEHSASTPTASAWETARTSSGALPTVSMTSLLTASRLKIQIHLPIIPGRSFPRSSWAESILTGPPVVPPPSDLRPSAAPSICSLSPRALLRTSVSVCLTARTTHFCTTQTTPRETSARAAR